MSDEQKQAVAEGLIGIRAQANALLKLLAEQPAAEPVREKKKPLTFSAESKARQEREKAENG